MPKLTEKQLIVQKKRLSHLRRGVLKASVSTDIVMDDEAYFSLSELGMPSNVGYYTDKKKSVLDHVKFFGKKKYPQRVMVW